jgi:hypothetical protein
MAFITTYKTSWEYSSLYNFRVVMSATISAKKSMFGMSKVAPVVYRMNVLIMLFVFVCAKWWQIRLEYMSKLAGVL